MKIMLYTKQDELNIDKNILRYRIIFNHILRE